MNLRIFLLVLICIGNARANELFKYDFEGSCNVSDYKDLDLPKLETEIVNDYIRGKYLKVSSVKPSKYCVLRIKQSFDFKDDLVLSFDVKTKLLSGNGIKYLAVGLYGENGVRFFKQLPASDQHRNVELPFHQLKQSAGESGYGAQINRIEIYGRGDGEVRMEICIDNIKLDEKIQVYTSAANPPFFNWKPVGKTILEYSRNADFSSDVERVEAEFNFYTPDKYLTPGKYYWRLLKDGKYSGVKCIEVPEKTHEFLCPAIDADYVLSKPRPWLVAQKKLTEKERAELRKEYEERPLKNLTHI